MWTFFERLLDFIDVRTHGMPVVEPELIWLHVASDVVMLPPIFRFRLRCRSSSRSAGTSNFGWVFWAFALFIMACGVGHVMSIITRWVSVYGIEGIVKGDDGRGIDRDGGDAMAAVAEGACAAPSPVAASRP